MIRKLYIILVLMIFLSCSERDKNNPFDPSGDLPLAVKILSFDNQIELIWGDPIVTDYTGFNIYRRISGVETEYRLIADHLPPSAREFNDYQINYYYTYEYYVTITGRDIESRPSLPVSITPGPGINWVVDKWGYLVLRMTYDAAHTISVYETDWPPTAMAVSGELGVGVVLYALNGVVEKINFAGSREARYDQLPYPMDIAFDPADSLFWMVDSSGIIVTLDTRTDRFSIIARISGQPVSIDIAGSKNIISIVDLLNRRIIQYNREGQWLGTLDHTVDAALTNPVFFASDEVNQGSWVIDRRENQDYILHRFDTENDFRIVDSTLFAGPIRPSITSASAWYVSYKQQNSSIVQLSTNGTRHLELFGFYSPYDIEINPFDGTLLVSDTGNSRVLHYNEINALIGWTGTLNFPVKIVVE